jgi:hypothetical protein
MVRNPGLIPGLESIRAGDIGARRKNMYEMMVGLYFPYQAYAYSLAGFLVSTQVKALKHLSLRTPLLPILPHTLTFIVQKSLGYPYI